MKSAEASAPGADDREAAGRSQVGGVDHIGRRSRDSPLPSHPEEGQTSGTTIIYAFAFATLVTLFYLFLLFLLVFRSLEENALLFGAL